MNAFQAVSLSALAVLTVITIVVVISRRIRKRWLVVWTALWSGAAAAIAFPDMTNRAARLLGIGRGADLVLYGALLSVSAVLFVVFQRFHSLDQTMTRLVRALAIAGVEPVVNDTQPAPPPRSEAEAP